MRERKRERVGDFKGERERAVGLRRWRRNIQRRRERKRKEKEKNLFY